MERGSDKHGAFQDDQLAKELDGMLGQAGGHREDWREMELPVDDDDDDLDAPEQAAAGQSPGAVDDRGPEPRG